MRKIPDSMPICRHFGTCGGCRSQDIPYPLQLKKKETQCRELLSDYLEESALAPIVGSPSPIYYRNKMEFTFGTDENGKLACGLHMRQNSRRVFELFECLIFSPHTTPVMTAVRKFRRDYNLEPYNCRRHTGFWRNLVLRETKFTGRLMVNLVTTSAAEVDTSRLLEYLRSELPPDIKLSLLHTINDDPADAVKPGKFNFFSGDEWLDEEIDGLTFRIPPFSFFQVNPEAIKVFYRELKKLPWLEDNTRVLDIFCGTGPLGIVLAGISGQVTGIELDPYAVETARLNCRLNGVENSRYIIGDARKILLANRETWQSRFNLVVVNPPRSGLSKKVIKRILEIAPPTILYSSCNPKTFALQAGAILEQYDLVYARPFDFFPHTPHLELMTVFKRREDNSHIAM